MEDYELILFDRVNVIKDTINKYGEDNFYLLFSGGKDSTIIHYLVDEAIPNNKIPRLFINTGIEYTYIYQFVKELSNKDKRIIIYNSRKNIKQTLEEKGYPFKSKDHSNKLYRYKLYGMTNYIQRYLDGINYDGSKTTFVCPKCLKHQFTEEYKLNISDRCCYELKKEPAHKWAKENNKKITITGMRSEEGGQRTHLNCLTNNGTKFHPLVKVSDSWEEWYINKRNINLCKLYYPPFNFRRSGCKGCPFSLDLKEQLDIMRRLLPNEAKQCEIIWKPVYEEYRRIGYRLEKNEQIKLL